MSSRVVEQQNINPYDSNPKNQMDASFNRSITKTQNLPLHRTCLHRFRNRFHCILYTYSTSGGGLLGRRRLQYMCNFKLSAVLPDFYHPPTSRFWRFVCMLYTGMCVCI